MGLGFLLRGYSLVAVATLVSGSWSCGGPGPVTRVRILDSVSPDGSLALADRDVPTLKNVARVSGDIAQLRGHATIRIDPVVEIIDRGESRAEVVRDDGSVQSRWVWDDHTVVPTDYDSMVMLTAYAHFEQAANHFAAMGVAPATNRVPIYYKPSFVIAADTSYPQSDNAAFFPEADGFVLLPMRIFQEVPFPMNPGVIAHEYTHRVVYYLLWGGEMFSALRRFRDSAGSLAAWNRIRATDEGLADFFGAAITSDPDFLAKSAPPEVAEPRHLNRTRVLDPLWIDGRQPTDDQDQFEPYLPGAVIAAALWKMGQVSSVPLVERAVLDSLHALEPQVAGQFQYEFGDLETEVIAHLPAEHRDEACAVLAVSHAAVWSRIARTCP